MPEYPGRDTREIPKGYSMPLFIKDEGVNALAERIAALTGQGKTDAVRVALEAQIRAIEARSGLTEPVRGIQARAAALGLVADGCDDKPLMDDLSGDADVH